MFVLNTPKEESLGKTLSHFLYYPYCPDSCVLVCLHGYIECVINYVYFIRGFLSKSIDGKTENSRCHERS